MSEPFLERLSRFTPDAGGLDRDTLLFATGRNSARPNRSWIVLSAVLAGTQVIALALLLPRSGGRVPGQNRAFVHSSAPHLPAQNAERVEPTNSRIWSVRHELKEMPLDDRIAESLVLVESEPTLRAFGLFPSAVN